MPTDAPQVKLDNTRALGAEVVLYDRPGGEDRDAVADKLVRERNLVLVHAYADPWIIEGQGSTGIEIAAQMAERAGGPPTRIVACCGGGGLTAGLALACPDAEIVPVEPEGWDDICRSLESGTIQRVDLPNAPATACDALQTPATRPINFAILQGRDHPLGAGQRGRGPRCATLRALPGCGWWSSRAARSALAAVLSGKVPSDGRTALTLSGGNVDPAAYARVIAGND